MSPTVIDPSEGVIPFDRAVDRLAAQFGSENQATIVAVVNEKQREMLAMSEYRASTPSIGTTVAGQVQFPIADVNAESLRLVRVGTVMYQRVSTERLWNLQDAYSGTGLVGPGGVFAPSFGDDGTRYIEFYPEPTAGQSVEVLEYGWVADVAYASGAYLAISTDVFSKLLSGCRAYLYREVEERPDLAPPEEADFQAGIQELRSRKFRRAGGGVGRMSVGVGGRW